MTSASNPVRLGIVGCGYIADFHARAAERLADSVRIVACADPAEDRAIRFGQRYGCEQHFRDYEQMLDASSLDGVIVATWPSLHEAQILSALNAGVQSILCEKPLVTASHSAQTVWNAVAGSDAIVMEGLMYRHHPAIERIHRLLRQGEVGPIDRIRASFSYLKTAIEWLAVAAADPNDPDRPWRTRPDAGGGAIYDLGTYAINACGHFAGALPVRVAALGRSDPTFGTNEQLCGCVEYANGCLGIVEVSECAAATQELDIVGAYGALHLPEVWNIYEEISIERREIVPERYRDPLREKRVLYDHYVIPAADPYEQQLINFVEASRGGARPKISLGESVVNTFVLDALVVSLAESRVVDLDIPPDIAQVALPESKLAVDRRCRDVGRREEQTGAMAAGSPDQPGLKRMGD